MLVWLAACGGEASAPKPPQIATPAPALTPVAAPTTAETHLVYVPVYSSIYHGDGAATFNLAVTLSVRNTDQAHPLTLHSVRYYDNQGKLLHDYLDAPGTLGPLSSSDIVVRASDTRGGVGASFLVEWSGQDLTPPVVEGVMIGTASQQGLSFVTRGEPIR